AARSPGARRIAGPETRHGWWLLPNAPAPSSGGSRASPSSRPSSAMPGPGTRRTRTATARASRMFAMKSVSSNASPVSAGAATDWNPTSWQTHPARQQPEYPDAGALARVIEDLSRLPPLVTSWEVEGLRQQLAEAATGQRFLLQGGDCAESFADCTSGSIADKLKIFLQLSLVLVHGGRKRVIRVGRFAGQYAKPRSDDREVKDGVSLPSYRGDLINHAPFTLEARTPDPELLLRGYERAALTVNFIRALIDGGFADLHHPEYWDLDFVRHAPLAAEYQRMVEAIGDSLRFMETVA